MKTIREYCPNDKEICLEIFESNLPQYFNFDEKLMFAEWLEKTDREEYYVLMINSEIVACGGLYYDDKKDEAGLAWGMVHQDFHKKGYGQMLTEYRLDKLSNKYPTAILRIETSQFTENFYKKMGFKTESIVKDGFGPGLDKYCMKKSG